MATDIMDIAETATYLHIKKGTLYRLVKAGMIPGTKIGGQWRFKREVLDELFRLAMKPARKGARRERTHARSSSESGPKRGRGEAQVA